MRVRWLLTSNLILVTVGIINGFSQCPALGAPGDTQLSQLQQPGQTIQPGTLQTAPTQTQVTPGVQQKLPSQPIQLSQELKTAQAVERIEQTLTAMAAHLNVVINRLDAFTEQLRIQTAQHRELPPNQRWELVFGGQAVLDKETGLVWERSPKIAQMRWEAASATCPKAVLDGRAGWRLPTIQELQSLAPLTQQNPFVNVQWGGLSWYWTSTPIFEPDSARTTTVRVWSVGFRPTSIQTEAHFANSIAGSKDTQLVWCVRGR